MKVKLVFADWQKNGKSIYQTDEPTEEGIELSLGDFHSGTVFDAEINLDKATSKELEKAIENGFTPVFDVIPGK